LKLYNLFLLDRRLGDINCPVSHLHHPICLWTRYPSPTRNMGGILQHCDRHRDCCRLCDGYLHRLCTRSPARCPLRMVEGGAAPTFAIAIVGLMSSIASTARDTETGFARISHWGVGLGCWILGLSLFVLSLTRYGGKDHDNSTGSARLY
jgi:hypothetical protein